MLVDAIWLQAYLCNESSCLLSSKFKPILLRRKLYDAMWLLALFCYDQSFLTLSVCTGCAMSMRKRLVFDLVFMQGWRCYDFSCLI